MKLFTKSFYKKNNYISLEEKKSQKQNKKISTKPPKGTSLIDFKKGNFHDLNDENI